VGVCEGCGEDVGRAAWVPWAESDAGVTEVAGPAVDAAERAGVAATSVACAAACPGEDGADGDPAVRGVPRSGVTGAWLAGPRAPLPPAVLDDGETGAERGT